MKTIPSVTVADKEKYIELIKIRYYRMDQVGEEAVDKIMYSFYDPEGNEWSRKNSIYPGRLQDVIANFPNLEEEVAIKLCYEAMGEPCDDFVVCPGHYNNIRLANYETLDSKNQLIITKIKKKLGKITKAVSSIYDLLDELES